MFPTHVLEEILGIKSTSVINGYGKYLQRKKKTKSRCEKLAKYLDG